MGKPLPISIFDTTSIPPAGQFPAWRDSMAPMLEVAPPGEAPPPAFRAGFESYLAGPLVLGGTSFEAHRYYRDEARVRRDALNHFHVTLHLSGRMAGRFGARDVLVGTGDVTLFDFARPMDVRSEAAELLVVAVPRDVLEGNLPPGEHHGLVLRGDSGLGGLLADHMRSLAARLPLMTTDDAAAAASATTAMIAACFHPSAARFAAADGTLLDSLHNRIRQHIGERLQGGDIGADAICRSFGISRSTLYRLFEPHGGIAAFVRNQRLSRVFTALMSPLEAHRTIADIAFEWGFTSEAHFSRAFRQAFGLTPREARQAVTAGPATEAERVNQTYRDWLVRLRRK